MNKVQLRYGFLFNGLTPQYYYYEVSIFFIKFCIIFATDFLAIISPSVQCLVGILMVLFNLLFVLRQHPFATAIANNTNLFSKLVHIIRLYAGVYYISVYG